jgi:hypothetical protein
MYFCLTAESTTGKQRLVVVRLPILFSTFPLTEYPRSSPPDSETSVVLLPYVEYRRADPRSWALGRASFPRGCVKQYPSHHGRSCTRLPSPAIRNSYGVADTAIVCLWHAAVSPGSVDYAIHARLAEEQHSWLADDRHCTRGVPWRFRFWPTVYPEKYARPCSNTTMAAPENAPNILFASCSYHSDPRLPTACCGTLPLHS